MDPLPRSGAVPGRGNGSIQPTTPGGWSRQWRIGSRRRPAPRKSSDPLTRPRRDGESPNPGIGRGGDGARLGQWIHCPDHPKPRRKQWIHCLDRRGNPVVTIHSIGPTTPGGWSLHWIHCPTHHESKNERPPCPSLEAAHEEGVTKAKAEDDVGPRMVRGGACRTPSGRGPTALGLRSTDGRCGRRRGAPDGDDHDDVR